MDLHQIWYCVEVTDVITCDKFLAIGLGGLNLWRGGQKLVVHIDKVCHR